jgi:hypothetical protein
VNTSPAVVSAGQIGFVTQMFHSCATAPGIFVAVTLPAAWHFLMSEKSRARAAARRPTRAKASATVRAIVSAEGANASAASYSPPFSEPNAGLVRGRTLLAGGLVVLAALVAYHNSFSGPFIADDVLSIQSNPTIRQFGTALSPPSYVGAGGRPLLNFQQPANG